MFKMIGQEVLLVNEIIYRYDRGMNLRDMVENHCKNKKISITKFAEKIKVQRAFLYRLMDEEIGCSRGLLHRIAKELKVDVLKLEVLVGNLPEDLSLWMRASPEKAYKALKRVLKTASF